MYKLMKCIIGFAIRQFFSSIKLRGAAVIENGPVIFVANHPNQAMDSLVVGSVFKRDLWFLAKATLFSNPILDKFFRSCHMLPVQRRTEKAEGALDNQDTFRSAVEKLCQGEAVVIFPEGTSMGERRMLPLKTGTARIAFLAEESKNFELDLQIQAVGITYSELNEFRSSVTLTFAEPIRVINFKSSYESDAQQAVRDLTAAMESHLLAVTVGLQDQKHNDLVEKIAAIYRTRASKLDDKELLLTVAANVEALRDDDKVRSSDLEKRINDYVELSSVFAVDGTVILDQEINELQGLLLSPLMTLAFFVNFVPYRLVGKIVKRVSAEPVYIATNKFSFGILIFLSWYLLIALIVAAVSESFMGFLLAFVSCLFLGHLINNYQSHFKLFLLSRLWPGKKKPIDLLRLMRDQLVEELESLRIK